MDPAGGFWLQERATSAREGCWLSISWAPREQPRGRLPSQASLKGRWNVLQPSLTAPRAGGP